MKTGRSLSDLAAEIERQRTSKRDFIAPGKSLRMVLNENDLRFDLASEGAFEIETNFHDQLGETLAIPRNYYQRLQREAPELLITNVNYFLPEQGKRMVRTLDGKARAFLSDRYRPLDHYELLEAVLPQIQATDCAIESCEVTDKRLYVKAISKRITGEVNVGDVVQAGIMISNSEIGLGSLSVQPLIYRLVCRNGAIVSDAKLRKAHIGRNGYGELNQVIEFYRDETKQASDRAFFLQVRDTVAAMLNETRFQSIVGKMQAAFGRELPAQVVEPVVEEVTKRYTLNEGERSSMLAHLIAGGDLSQYGLMNAVTRMSQDVKSYDRATELETIGGDILEISPRDWASLTASRNN